MTNRRNRWCRWLGHAPAQVIIVVTALAGAIEATRFLRCPRCGNETAPAEDVSEHLTHLDLPSVKG